VNAFSETENAMSANIPDDEIKVTAAMIRAGLAALFPAAELHPAADEAEVMGRVFRAMERARICPESNDRYALPGKKAERPGL